MAGARGNVYIPARGDIVWMSFDPARGREQKGARPALIVSAREFNMSGLAYAVPVTSKKKGYPIEVPVRGRQVKGVVLTSHLRAIDWHERRIEFVERCPEETLLRVLGLIVAFMSED